MSSRGIRRFFTRQAVAVMLAVLAGAGTVSAVDASSASALQWDAPITFDCYQNSVIRADPIGMSIGQGQGNIVWGLFLERRNPTTRQWVHTYTSPLQHYDSSEQFGYLVLQPIDVRVAPNRYYMAYDVIAANGSGAHLYRDQAEIGATSEFVCRS